MALDKLRPTGRRGVFYQPHPTRRHGVKRDRLLILRYTLGGKTFKGVFGWESEGKTELDAEQKIAEFRANFKTGEGPITLAEERESEDRKKQEAEAEAERLQREEEARSLTLNDFFTGPYLEAARLDKKPRTVQSEVAIYGKWIKPLLGDIPLLEITPWHFQQLKAKVIKGDRKTDEAGKVTYVAKSPRTVHYAVSILAQVLNMAHEQKKVDTPPPHRKELKLPMIDNERTRAFSPEQAVAYFKAMRTRSRQWHDISKISLFCGLRASEVFRLELKDFDEERGLLFLKTPKKQRSQFITLNNKALRTLKRLKRRHPTGTGLFFTDRNGHPITEVSNTCQDVIDSIGCNDGVTDRRDRLTFHSWRHTFATWLLDQDEDLYVISRLLRHSSLAMTKKYAHLKEERLRTAAGRLDKVLTKRREEKKAEAEAAQPKG